MKKSTFWEILDTVQMIGLGELIWYSYTREFFGPMFVGMAIMLLEITPGLCKIILEGARKGD